MKRQKREGTKPEIRLRKLLHARGLRYRVNYALPFDRRRRCDVAFTKQRVAVFVDGCWWHRCPAHSTIPKSNRDWWIEKLTSNVARDRDTDHRLRQAGWTVVRAWEHEDSALVADRVEALVRGASSDD
jgi:DNA mismatch endonuclease, patch repair protein